MNKLINYGGDCRTAPATPGLLISFFQHNPAISSLLYYALLVMTQTYNDQAATNPLLHQCSNKDGSVPVERCHVATDLGWAGAV